MRSGLLLKILSFILICLFFSCEEQVFFINCSECEMVEPEKATLDIELEINYFMSTRIDIYEGALDDSILFSTKFTSQPKTSIDVPLNKMYTVTATYYKPPEYYIAVDMASPTVIFSEKKCDDPCYYVIDRHINLHLKPQ